MSGYRESSFDPDAGEIEAPRSKIPWWQQLLIALAYLIPLFWLWNETDYPDSLGVRVTAHGKAGVLENWYYSYLLLQRRDPFDVLTFAYMWAPLVGFVSWIAFRQLRRMKFSKLSIYADDDQEPRR